MADERTVLEELNDERCARAVEALRWGDIKEAQALLVGLLEAGSEGARVLAHHAATLIIGGRPEEAERELRRAIDIDPRCADAWVNLGNLEYLRGDYTGAVQAYLRAVRIDRGLVRAYHNMAAAYGKLGLKRKERAARRKARELEYIDFLRRGSSRGVGGCGIYVTSIFMTAMLALLLYLYMK